MCIPTLAHPKIPVPPSNPWGLQDFALPVMGITLPPTGKVNVTYTPVEAFQPLPPVSPSTADPLLCRHALLLIVHLYLHSCSVFDAVRIWVNNCMAPLVQVKHSLLVYQAHQICSQGVIKM